MTEWPDWVREAFLRGKSMFKAGNEIDSRLLVHGDQMSFSRFIIFFAPLSFLGF